MVFFEGRKRRVNEILEHCALNVTQSKLRPTNQDLSLLTFKVKTFQNENQDPNIQSSLE